LKIPQEIDDVYFLKNEAENIAPFLLYLKNNDINIYNKIVEVTRLVYPVFNDFELQESPTSKGKIVLRWTEKGSNNIFNIKQISDGTIRFICLATLLMQPKESKFIPNTIILDEPELGLHPFAIHVLSELIKKASLYRQIFIATQSVTLINHFEPEDLLIAKRNEDGETIFQKKTSEDLKEWLEDYTLGELWENNFIGGRP
jgi:predicted ATPase